MRVSVRLATATAVALAFALPAHADPLKEIGKGEGEVDIVAWAGYIERGETDKAYDWVTDFEKATSCKVNVKVAGTSDEMVTLMNGGGFDLVTASGDASLRLVAGKKVQEINTDLIPNWKNVDPRLQNAPWHTVDGKHYGTPYQWGPNVLMYNTDAFKGAAPTSWSVVFEEQTLPDGKSNKGRVQAYSGAIYIADAALYLMSKKPELGIKDPYELSEDQYKAVLDLLRGQKPLHPALLARCHRPDRRLHQRGRRRLRLVALPGQPAASQQEADRLDHSGGRRHRLGRHHHDACQRGPIRTAPTCGWSIRSSRRCRATSPPGSARSPRCRPPAQAMRSSPTPAATQRHEQLRQDQVLEDADRQMRHPGSLRALLALGFGLHRHRRRTMNLNAAGGVGAMSAPTPTAVSFRGVERHFGTVRAVDGVDLDIAPGEFFAMLGPSGSGKTTCLRLIAGFEQPTAGSIQIFGDPVAGVPAYRRPVNTVFQDYALFPHMNVLDNVCYGLKVRRVPKAERERLAREALALVKLSSMEARRPSQLSGGQRQRVALARALVVRPKVLLLDEPLGALDLKLREDMQGELKGLHRTLGLTFVFVTHDQGEALSMADRVAVFNDGRIVQVGAPEDIYERPRTRFVADFVGGSNVIEPLTVLAWIGRDSAASLRPEKISLLQQGVAPLPDHVSVAASVEEVLYHGPMRRVEMSTAVGPLVAAIPATFGPSLGQGSHVTAAFPRSALHLMEAT